MHDRVKWFLIGAVAACAFFLACALLGTLLLLLLDGDAGPPGETAPPRPGGLHRRRETIPL